MATLDQLRSYRDRLLGARFNGVRTVRDSNGEEVTYKSDAELAAALRALEIEIQYETLRPAKIFYPRLLKGL